MIRRDVDPNTDDVVVLTICDACGEEGHDAPAESHDDEGELRSTLALLDVDGTLVGVTTTGRRSPGLVEILVDGETSAEDGPLWVTVAGVEDGRIIVAPLADWPVAR